MTTNGKKNTVNIIAHRMNHVEGRFEEIKKDFVTLARNNEKIVSDAITKSDEIIRSDMEKAFDTINDRLILIERALLMSPIKRWWMTFRGRLFS
jgi:chromosome segregation ATPase